MCLVFLYKYILNNYLILIYIKPKKNHSLQHGNVIFSLTWIKIYKLIEDSKES